MTGDCWEVASELTPLSDYDERAARERISFKWLILKSHLHVKEIPKELVTPFYVDLDGNFSIKPILVNLLSSGELYCQACANLFYEWQLPFHDTSSVICSLARKGFYVEEDNGIGVTESVLKQTSPLKLNAHLLLIDAMMEAVVKNNVTIEASVKAVRETGAKFSPSSDLPESPEDAILFWLGRVASISRNGRRTFTDILDDDDESSSSLADTSSKSTSLPSSLDDVSDGIHLCVLLTFYFGRRLFRDHPPSIPEVGEEPTSIADSIRNLKLFLAASRRLFPSTDFPFRDVRVEDLLYSPDGLGRVLFCMLSQIFASLSSLGYLKRDTHPPTNDDDSSGIHLDDDDDDVDECLDNDSTTQRADSDASSSASTDGRRPQSLFGAPSITTTDSGIPPISKVTKQSFVQQAGMRSVNGRLLTPDSPSSHSSVARSPSLTPGGAKRFLAADPSTVDYFGNQATPRKPNGAVGNGEGFFLDSGIDSARSQRLLPSTSSQQSQTKPRPRSAVEGPTIYSALSSSGDNDPSFGGNAFGGESVDFEQTSLLENCDLDDDNEVDCKTTRRSGGSGGFFATLPIKDGAPCADGSGDFYSKKVPRKKWRASAEDETPFKLDIIQKPATTSVAGPKDVNGGTWSKSSSPLVLSAASPRQQPATAVKKIGGDRNLSSRSFNVGEKVITEQAARAANIPVIGEGTDENLQVQFFLKKSSSPQPLNGDLKTKVTTPFIPKFGDEDMAKDLLDRDDDDVATKQNDVGRRRASASSAICGKVFLGGDAAEKDGPKTATPAGSNNRLSALFGSCDNFPAVLGQSTTEKESDERHVEREEKNSVPPNKPPPGSTNFVEISHQHKLVAPGKQTIDPLPMASPKSSLKTTRSSRDDNPPDKLLNPTTWGAIGQDRGEFKNTGSQKVASPNGSITIDNNDGRSPLSIQLAAMRLRLEEKKRAIERDKIKAESRANKDRQKFGKTVFLKVIGSSANASGTPSHFRQNPESTIIEERETPGTSPGQTPTHETGKHPLAIKPETGSEKSEPKRDSEKEPTLRSVPEEVDSEQRHPPSPSDFPPPPPASKERLRSEGNESTGSRKSSSGSYEAASGSSSLPLKSRVRTVSSGSDPPHRDTPSPSSSVGTDTQCIEQLNASLFELQSEIKRLSFQQEQLKLKQIQSQFHQQPSDYGVPAQPPPVFSPPRPDAINGGFVGYNPQILPGPYAPYAHGGLGMPGQLNPIQPAGGAPIMMPTFSPSLNNLIQQQPHPPQNLPLHSGTQFGSMVSIPSGTSSPMPPYYLSQGNLNVLNNAFADGTIDDGRRSSDARFDSPQFSARRASSDVDEKMEDVQTTPVGEKEAQPLQRLPEQRIISFGENDHVVVDRWKRDSEGDASMKECELDEDHLEEAQLPAVMDRVDLSSEKSPRNVAWMTPPSSAGKVRESLAMQTPTSTNSTLSVSDRRRTPSSGESRESVNATTPEVCVDRPEQRQRHMSEDETGPSPPQANRPPPTSIVIKLDPAGYPQEVLDINDANETLFPGPDNHAAERKKEEVMRRFLKRQEEAQQRRMNREAEAAAKREEAQRKHEEQERKKEADRQKKEALLKNYKDQKREEEIGPVEKEIRQMRQKAQKKTLTPDRGRSTSHQNLTASPLLARSIQDIQNEYAPLNNNATTDNHFAISSHTPVMRNPEGGGTRVGSVTRRTPSRPLSTHGGSVSTLNESETQSIAGDYSGPKLYVQPSPKTNKKIIVNSLSQCCLAGTVNNTARNKVLAELENSDAKHFLILFRDAGCQYRGVYGFDPDSLVVSKICGSGPRIVDPSMIEKYFKYSSGGKKFDGIYAKQMSVTIDAFTIHNHLWQTAKARNGSKTRPVSMYN